MNLATRIVRVIGFHCLYVPLVLLDLIIAGAGMLLLALLNYREAERIARWTAQHLSDRYWKGVKMAWDGGPHER